MNTTEDRLRAAFAARAEKLTEPKLDELAARHQAGVESLNDLERGEHTVVLEPIDFDQHRKARHRGWVAPVVAAAAVAAVAIAAATTISRHATSGPAAPPASGTGSAAPSVRTSPITTSPSPKSSQPDGYLARGETGDRTAVPWSSVGAGWRLIQPWSAGTPTRELYLYDPANGRYRISTDLPPDADVVGWSPDGAQAALQLASGVEQIDLHSGEVSTVVSHKDTFITYTRPQGLALLVASDAGLQRYGSDGSLQLTYSNKINGVGRLGQGPNPIFYTDDGTAFVAPGTDRAVLISNSGQPVRAYELPTGTSKCVPIRRWNSAAFLESCTGSVAGLYLQPFVVSGAGQALASAPDASFVDAWLLSNQDVLVQPASGACQPAGYQILHPDGSLSALRLPAGVPDPAWITSMDGNLATFSTATQPCNYRTGGLLDYNMVTGMTTQLLSQPATIVNFPDK